MIYITSHITLNENELNISFIRSSGPGGQNVNKVATAVQLRFNVQDSASLPEEVRWRLLRIAKKRITHDGVLIITAQNYRTQHQNRQDALDRLIALIQQAAIKPKHRVPTKRTRSSRERRLAGKSHRQEIKHLRKSVKDIED